MARELKVRRSDTPADQDPGATDEAIAGVYARPRVRRPGRLKVQAADKSALTIKVSTAFKQKLQTLCLNAGLDAGEFLEGKARRDVDERLQRIVGAWTFLGTESGPPALPGPETSAA